MVRVCGKANCSLCQSGNKENQESAGGNHDSYVLYMVKDFRLQWGFWFSTAFFNIFI
jgi:hypothetical protein